VVIDGGSRQVLLNCLKGRGIAVIDAVLVSHADYDHVGGIIELLLEPQIEVRKIYLNPDALRRTRTWDNFRIALADVRKRYHARIHTQLTTTCTEEFERGKVRLEVLAPLPETSAAGVGSRNLRGETLTANSLSAVIRVATRDVGEVLLAGDMDEQALGDILGERSDLQARVLVFPHHGGLPGDTDAERFAQRLCQAVRPLMIVFSIGRDQFSNPRPEIVAGARQGAPQAHIACTQLSRHCAATVPAQASGQCGAQPAGGLTGNKCCAGTIEVLLGRSELMAVPTSADHIAFVDAHAPTALCRRQAISQNTTGARPAGR
jgi:beta-lactamase superfamily II metal-dependent hydrolase